MFRIILHQLWVPIAETSPHCESMPMIMSGTDMRRLAGTGPRQHLRPFAV